MNKSCQQVIRHSKPSDICMMQQIFEDAKIKMRETGNMAQRAGRYPSDELLLNDIDRKFNYNIEE